MAARKKAAKKTRSSGRATVSPRRQMRLGVNGALQPEPYLHEAKGAKHTKLYVPLQTPAIHVGDERFETDDRDRGKWTAGSIQVPTSRVNEFLAMGCTKTPPTQQPKQPESR